MFAGKRRYGSRNPVQADIGQLSDLLIDLRYDRIVSAEQSRHIARSPDSTSILTRGSVASGVVESQAVWPDNCSPYIFCQISSLNHGVTHRYRPRRNEDRGPSPGLRRARGIS